MLTLINRKNSYFQLVIQIAAVLLTGVIAYSNSFNVPFQFDDFSISGIVNEFNKGNIRYTRYFVDLSFAVNNAISGENVVGYHVVNLFVHLTAAIVLLFLVRSVLTALSVSFPPPAAQRSENLPFMELFIPCSTALLFVTHPVQMQAVTYVVQRYASFAALFYMGSILGYIHARLSAIHSHRSYRVWIAATCSLLSGLIAILCKETAYTLPFMLIVIEIFLFKGQGVRNRLMVCLVAGMLITVVAVQASLHGTSLMEDTFFNLQRATKEELTYSRSEYLMTQFGVVATYLRLLLLPINQNIDYDIPIEKSLFILTVLAPLLLHVIIISTAIVLFFRSRRCLSVININRGVCLRLIALGVVWFYVALMVESSIIPILDVMFEHRLYLPSAGAFLAFSAAFALLAGPRPSWQKPVWMGLVIVCTLLVAATLQRNYVWNDDLRLWQDTVEKSPDKPRVLANLAGAYLLAGKPELAVPYLIRSLELAPTNLAALSKIELLVGRLQVFQGRYDSNVGFMTESRKTDYRNLVTNAANSMNNLGLLYEYTGNYEKACQSFLRATDIEPSLELAWYNLCLNSIQRQDRELTLLAYNKLKALSPERVKYFDKYIADQPRK